MTDIDRLRSSLDARYVVDREVGAGGMATVYLAQDTRHHRKVAIKVLRPELSASLGADRFHREIEVAAQLQHPHILPLLDSGEAAGFLYFVMPFVDGESLRERLARHGELPVPEAVRILAEVVDALAHAHSRGVVHRDIKPDNILLSGRHALVTDFGVAKAVSEATGRQQLTTAGVALGTPSYMAPEQATADPQLDHRVDIYAVGALAYELLSGHPPFTGRSPQEILAAHVTTAPQPLRNNRPTISQALNDVVMRCLEKRPADRWQSADDLLAQLEPLMTPSTDMTPSQTRPSKAVAPGRSRALWFVAGAAVLAATAFATTMLQRGGTSLTLGRAQPLSFEAGLEIEPALSPDGRYVAYSAGTLNRMHIFVRQAGGRPIAVTADSATYQRRPLWSPDGTQLLFSEGGNLVVAPALGGASRVLVRRTDAPVHAAAWSPDGARIAFVVEDSLLVRATAGGSERLLVSGSQMFGLAWSPDGEHIAYVAGDPRFSTAGVQYFGNIAPTSIRTIRADGGDPQTVTAGSSLDVSPAWLPDGRGLLFVSNRDGPRDVYAIALSDGPPRGDARRVTSGLNPHSVSVSADGSRIAYAAYTARSNIWAVPLRPGAVATTADARQITTGNQLIEGVTVSADGKSLYYDSDRDGTPDIYRIPIGGGEPERITTDPTPEFNPVESPDGKWIAFHSFKHGNRDIFVLPRDGGEPVRVTSDSTHEQLPVWSPNSAAITFFRHGYGMRSTPHVVKRQSDGTWSTPRAIDAVMGGTPRWLNDSTLLVRGGMREIAMQTLRGQMLGVFHSVPESRVMAYPVTTSDGRFFYRTYDADGGSSFWRVDRAGAPARLVARLNDPNRPATRGEFDTDGRVIYLTITDRQSDIYVAELARR